MQPDLRRDSRYLADIVEAARTTGRWLETTTQQGRQRLLNVAAALRPTADLLQSVCFARPEEA